MHASKGGDGSARGEPASGSARKRFRIQIHELPLADRPTHESRELLDCVVTGHTRLAQVLAQLAEDLILGKEEDDGQQVH